MTLCAGRARAEIPAGYAGTPFGGVPRPVPGRIDFEDFDEGGEGVGWDVDDHTGNFGEGGCAANDYRDDPTHPQLCKTNTNPGENDVYTVGALTGQKYPSNDMPQSIYIGYTHAVDWVKITVNVETAGTYKLSSSFASEPGGADGIKVQVSFNDVVKADATLAGTGGYHNWADYPDFATVELEAGVQVMTFAPKSQHVNYDFLQLSLVLPDGSVDDGSGNSGGGSGGTAGVGGNAGSAGTGGTDVAGTSGSGGNVGTSGSGGSDPLPSAGSAGSVPTAGGAAGASAGAPATVSPLTPAASDDASGCACRVGANQGSKSLALLAVSALFGAALLRRSRRR
ncbi:MAG TPA: hypothetical protein VM686_19280 [Polyangiaceae bacterium]|nr:hypothetical protein [Polyangiaceae bacterium]